MALDADVVVAAKISCKKHQTKTPATTQATSGRQAAPNTLPSGVPTYSIVIPLGIRRTFALALWPLTHTHVGCSSHKKFKFKFKKKNQIQKCQIQPVKTRNDPIPPGA
jgi:hypothetical protein